MPTNPAEVLLTRYTLGDLQLKNRIVMAPLTRTRADNRLKVPNGLMAEYYAQRAGAGLIITEGTFVSEQGQGWYGAPGVYKRHKLQDGGALPMPFIVWLFHFDEIHHRGQLSTYLGPMSAKVPSIYGASGDSGR